jgi:branched-chain amino acid transport system substrate-binding protein
LQEAQSSIHIEVQMMSVILHQLKCLVWAAICLIGVAACAEEKSAGPRGESIKIGAIYPFSGSNAATGEDLKAGVDLALEVINGAIDLPALQARTEGLSRRRNAKIEIIYRDSMNTPETAAALVEELVQREGVKGIIGCYSSTVTAAASERAEMLKIPFLNSESTSPTLTQRGFKWFFRTTPHDEMFSRNFFTFLSEFSGRSNVVFPKRLVLVFENQLWGTSVARAERKHAQNAGYEIVEEIPYDPKQLDLDEELKRIKSSLPAIILQASYEADAIALMRGYKSYQIDPLAILAMNAGFISPQFLKNLAEDGNYIMSREVWALDIGDRKPLVTSVNEVFRKKFGRNMTGNSARAFTGLMVMVDAVDRASSSDAISLRTALLNSDIKADQLIMPWDGVKFDSSTGQNILGRGIIVQVQDGQYWTVWPWDLASKPVIWPMPAWRSR